MIYTYIIFLVPSTLSFDLMFEAKKAVKLSADEMKVLESAGYA